MRWVICFVLVLSMMGEEAVTSLDFQYLIADAVGFGSTAFKVTGEDMPIIYIEAFPAMEACTQDPNEITEADVIIQNVHGHTTHYDPATAYLVAKNTGAWVLGNKQFQTDMIGLGLDSSKFVLMNPTPKEFVKHEFEDLGLKITAYQMEHTMMPEVYVDTYLIEMPNGVKWYHGTCSSGENTLKWMDERPELKNLDVMLLDCDIDFAVAKKMFTPKTLMRTHDFKTEIKPAPVTVYTDFPDGESMLGHGDVWTFTK